MRRSTYRVNTQSQASQACIVPTRWLYVGISPSDESAQKLWYRAKAALMKQGVAVPLLFRVAFTSDAKNWMKQHKTRRLWQLPVRQAVAVVQGTAALPEAPKAHKPQRHSGGKAKREELDKDGDAVMVRILMVTEEHLVKGHQGRRLSAVQQLLMSAAKLQARAQPCCAQCNRNALPSLAHSAALACRMVSSRVGEATSGDRSCAAQMTLQTTRLLIHVFRPSWQTARARMALIATF